MTEQYGFQFKVDATDAARGWKQFESAVEGVFKALDKMESHVEKTMGKVNDTSRKAAQGIKAFTAAGQALNALKFTGSSAKNIAALNAAMKQLKAPSAAQVKNLQSFFRALTLAGTGGGAAAARNINALKSAVNGFKAPSATNVRNIRDFFAALSTFRNNGLANAAGMFGTLNQISKFKAPSATQVRNLQNFLNAVAGLQIPRNGAQIARILEQISRAASQSSQNLRGLRGSLGSFNWNTFNNGSRQARLNMMGLQNAFSATYQMGSVLRSLLGSLTIAELGRSFFDATNNLATFKASLSAVSTTAGYVSGELQWLTDTTKRLGIDYASAQASFAKFAISANRAGASASDARNIFEGFGTAMAVMGLSADKQGDVMLALQQVMNKGYLAGEELNQQLNEHLPGALGFLRVALEKTGVTLEDALKKKMLDANKTLNFLADKYREVFGPSMAQALERPSAQMNILRTNLTKLMEAIGEAGATKGFVDLLKQINSYLTPEDIQRFADAIGQGIKQAVDGLANGVKWLHDNWDSLKGPLSVTLDLLGRWAVVSGSLKIAQFITTPLLGVGAALGGLRQAGLLVGALSSMSFMGPASQLALMSDRTRALTMSIIAMRTNLLASIAAMRAAATGTGVLTAAMTALRTGVAGAVTGLRGLVAFLGGATLLTLGAAAAAVYMFYNAVKSSNEVLDSNDDFLAKNAAKLQQTTQTLNMVRAATGAATVQNTAFGNSALTGAGFLASYTAKMDKATGGLWSMAAAARAATIENLKLQKADVTRRLAETQVHSTKELKNLSGNLWQDGQYAKAIGAYAYGNMQGWGSALGVQKSQSKINADVGNLKGLEASLNNQINDASTTPMDKWIAAEKAKISNSVGASPDLFRTAAVDDKDDKSGRSRKGRTIDPAKELDRLQRKADQVMQRIGENNPLKKITYDYIHDLTEQAQTLLTDNGYKQWMDQIKDAGSDTEFVMRELQDALSGAGVDQAVLNDLQKRYGVTVNDLTKAMEEQAAAIAYKTEQAKIDATFGGRVIKDMNDQVHLARLSATESRTLGTVMDEVRKRREQGLSVSEKEIQHLTEQLRLRERYLSLLEQEREFYENNGVNSYVNSLQTAGEAVHNLDKNFLQSLEDQFVELGTKGTFSIKSIADSVQKDLMKFAAGNITKGLAGLMSDGDSKNPTILGGLIKKMGFDTGFDKETAMKRFDAQNVDLYSGQVNISGDLMTGALGKTFANDNAGGIGPNGEIVVAAKKADTLESEMKQAMTSAVKDTSKVMRDDWGGAIQQLGGGLASLLSGGGGGGGLAKSLVGLGMKVFGGGGGGGLAASAASTIAANPGIFKEGGFSDSPVARWSNAPHYSQGTHNTTPGIPAVLHDNEAVIPLSRGRRVPVELTNGGSNGSGTVVNNNFHVSSPNADSFRRSQQQITGQLHRASARAVSRNN